jgi:hypothetical protein
VTNQSLAVERARKEANVMRSILSHWDIVEGGDIFDGLNFYEGCVDEAVNRRLDKITKDGFNLIFLDYQGSWGKDKEQAVRNLFKYQNLADGAILLLTLNKSPIELSRFERGRGCGQDGYHTKDQEVTCLGYIEDLCKEGGYHCDIILEDQYKDTVDMETLGFCISKVKPVVVVPKSLPMGD